MGSSAYGDWKVSTAVMGGADSEDPESLEVLRYRGQWAVEESQMPVIAGDKGLVLKSPAARHAISASFADPIVFDGLDKPLVVQYEVKLQQGLECGGR